MCGIAGIFKYDGQRIEIARLKSMTDSIEHRGPDGQGQWVNSQGNVGLGHRRLSILDLSAAGSQPMHYANGRYTITFNGEIYNYVEIRENLQKEGYKFISHSDTEVLLALYDQKKEKCLEQLDGMFSFVIWDEKEKTLFAARDRFGEKPFFYVNNTDYFAFGSEMKALWAFTGIKVPNMQMVNDYLRYGFLSNPQKPEATFYENIYQLPPASYIKIVNNKLTISKYWSVDINKQSDISFEQAQERFRELMLQSVSRRLRSDVEVGSSLSGGLDSSLIVCLVDELLRPQGKHINTFSARFKNFVKDEGKYMQYVVDKTGSKPHYIFSEGDVLNKELDKIFHHQEEPFGSASILVQYQVFELAKQNNVTVLLDGQGADEILAGYIPYYQSYFNELSRSGSKDYAHQLQCYQDVHGQNIINTPFKADFSLRRFLRENVPGTAQLAKFVRNRMGSIQAPDYLNADFFQRHRNADAPLFDYDVNSLNSHLWAHTSQYGLGTLLRYADRNSMAHSREVRLPFLSHELVEFLFSLPPTFKINNGWTKFIMRTTFEDVLPAEIAWRKDKIGYEPPQKDWLNKPQILERIMESRKNLVNNDILDKRILINRPEPAAANAVGDKSWEHIMVSKLF